MATLNSCLCLLLVVSLGCRKKELDQLKNPQDAGSAVVPMPVEVKPTEIAQKKFSGKLKEVARGFKRPVAIESFKNSLYFVVEQGGRLLVWDKATDTKKVAAKFSGLGRSNEQGLLGVAVGATKKFIILSYTKRNKTSVVSHFLIDEAGVVDRKSEKVLFTQKQPYTNHNGGSVLFAPDGRLLFGLGDGGGAGDPAKAGQNPDTFLAKIIAIPLAGGKPEVIHTGLRNPWKFDIDPDNSEMFIADVGQHKWEMIYHAKPGTKHNFGWNVVEGSHCFKKASCDKDRFTPPIYEYNHKEGLSVTGGIVYRGTRFPSLAGHYFFADYVTGLLRSVKAEGNEVKDWGKILNPDLKVTQVSSFGRTAKGELMLVSHTGKIYELVE